MPSPRRRSTGASNRTLATRFSLAISVALAAPATLRSQAPSSPDRPPGLTETQTRALVARYARTDHWALRALTLTALGPRWHPAGAEMLLTAFESDDKRLRAWALEALLASDASTLRAAASRALLDRLVRHELRDRNAFYERRVLALLLELEPRAGAREKHEWERWWRIRRPDHQPAPWIAPPPVDPRSARTTTSGLLARAFELSDTGLDLVLCLDTTGSMQATIDAARAALWDVVTLLRGIAPDLRLGLVHYRDLEDFPGGAERLVALTPDVARVERHLATLIAGGGGDRPERVEAGLALALARDTGWRAGASKVVVIAGDAPPHSGAHLEALELARRAREDPVGLGSFAAPRARAGRAGATSAASALPIVVATLGVGLAAVQGDAAEALASIAEAGGGGYAELATAGPGGTRGATRQILLQILGLVFGAGREEELERFVLIHERYREAAFLPPPGR